MASEVLLQAAILILTLAVIVAVHKLPKRAFTNLRSKNRTVLQSNRHFIQGSHLLARARSTASSHRAQSSSLAKAALAEAEAAQSLSPKDAAPLILKALALDLMDHKSSALKSLDLALSPPRVKSLSDVERADAMVKRAEMKVAVNRRRRVDSAVEDLVEAVRLNRDHVKGLCLLGELYEWKGLRDEARVAFEQALRAEPESDVAQDGFQRLNS